MAGISDCKHASNPYHVCSEYCFGKKGESKTQMARNLPGYGHDGAVKYNSDNRKTAPSGCNKASNPYHDCDELCSNRTTRSGRPEAKRNSVDTSKSFGGTKGYRPKPPRELTVPLSNVVSSESQVTKPHVSPEEKTNGDCIKPYSEESCFQEEPLPIMEQNKFSQLVLVSGNVPKADNLKNSRDTCSITSVKLTKDIDIKPLELSETAQIPAVHDKEEGADATASPNITSFHFPGIVHDLEQTDDEEVKSVSSEPSLSVGKYRVKANFAPILQLIIDKHGDIAASCKLESFSIRSYYLECVCYIVEELQGSKLHQISKSKVRQLLAILTDVESAKIDVGWLRSILEEVAEAVELCSRDWTVGAAKANRDHELEVTKRELESQMKDLKMKEKEIADAKAKVADTRVRLSELESKCLQLNEAISAVQLKVEHLESKALADELQ